MGSFLVGQAFSLVYQAYNDQPHFFLFFKKIIGFLFFFKNVIATLKYFARKIMWTCNVDTIQLTKPISCGKNIVQQALFTVDYNIEIMFLPLKKHLNRPTGQICIFTGFICQFTIVEGHLCPFINFLYSKFTLVSLKAKFHLTMARGILGFSLF